MDTREIGGIMKKQREFFESGATLPVAFRVRMLRRLYAAVKAAEGDIAQALHSDLGKNAAESYMCETGMALSSISYLIKNVGKFAAQKRVRTPIAQFAAVSYRQPTPYGCTLIQSPWNYPLLLTIGPLAEAIAAGNTAIVSPSEYAPATAKVVRRIAEASLPAELAAVVDGGREQNEFLLGQKFDLIFFTGSVNVGRLVAVRAAETLTPAILELGGKSPCIVDETAKLSLAAKRIVFGKLINCGQTCVAPDYILCSSKIKERLIEELKKQIEAQYGKDPLKDPRYGKIINKRHFDRVLRLIDPQKTVYGGRCDASALKIAPTILNNVSWDDAVMREEIFGPVLPVLTFESFREVFPLLKDRPKPLALYVFSQDKRRCGEVMSRCAFGGGCINDVIIHIATNEMGFGGVGESGSGSYHGKAGFDAFSHTKSIVDKKTFIDLPMRYRPHKTVNRGLIRLFLR